MYISHRHRQQCTFTLVIASSDYTYMTCSLFSQSQASTF